MSARSCAPYSDASVPAVPPPRNKAAGVAPGQIGKAVPYYEFYADKIEYDHEQPVYDPATSESAGTATEHIVRSMSSICLANDPFAKNPAGIPHFCRIPAG